MAVSERGCCVPRCGKTRKDDTVLHSFPNPDKEMDRYLAWTRAVGLDTSLDPHCVYRNRRVCHDHFELKFLTWTRRLSPGAIPTLLLPGSEMAGAPLIDIKNRPENVSFDGALPSTSRELDNFSNVCRICGSITDQSCPVFGEQGQCDDLAMKINKYLPIDVSPEDGLPQVVCEQCRSTLLAWHELVQCCVRADAALRQTVHNTDNTKPEDAVGSMESPTLIGTQAWLNISDVVRQVLSVYLEELNIEEENTDLEYVCQMCTERPASKSVEELTEHLRSRHRCQLQNKESIEDFVKDFVTFEEILILDRDDGDVSIHNDTDSVTETKDIKLQNYCCPFCESVFSSPIRLIYHLNKHIEISIAKGIVCCDELYENKLAFVAHLQDEHVTRIPDENTCKSCGITTSNFEELQSHIIEEHPESNDLNERKEILHMANRQKYIPVVCPKCNKTFSNKYNLRVHNTRSHAIKPLTFTCEKCNKSYKSQGSLNYHHKIHHEGNLRYLCTLCGEAFPTRGSRNVHARIHTGAKPFECYHCGKCYRAKNTLNRHMDIHLDIRKYACNLCPKNFRKRTHLNYHLRTHEKKYLLKKAQSDSTYSLRRPIISKTRPDPYQSLLNVKIENYCVEKPKGLDKHCNEEKEIIKKPEKIVTKDGKRYAVCDTCNKKIAMASWRRHLQSHSTVKRYSCHVCGLGFNDSGNLSRHRKAVHAEQRPYTCTTCKKSFSRNSHLQEHIRTHYENRDYICDACGKAFKSNATLRMHRKIHANEYRFRCMYCESKFRRKSELLVHISVHTGEKSHSCACGKAFRLRSQLRNHTRTHSKEIEAISQELE